MISSGKVTLNKQSVNSACSYLSISKGTFYRHIKDLRKRNWIGYSAQSRTYFIRSFKYIAEKESLEGKTCTVFSSEWFNSFKAYLSGSVIGYLVKHQNKAERKKRRSSQPKPVATKAISKIMNIPESTAYYLKRLAHKAKSIKVTRDYTFTGIHPSYKGIFKKCNPDIAHKVIIKNNQLCICMPDLVNELLRYKTSRSL